MWSAKHRLDATTKRPSPSRRSDRYLARCARGREISSTLFFLTIKHEQTIPYGHTVCRSVGRDRVKNIHAAQIRGAPAKCVQATALNSNAGGYNALPVIGQIKLIFIFEKKKEQGTRFLNTHTHTLTIYIRYCVPALTASIRATIHHAPTADRGGGEAVGVGKSDYPVTVIRKISISLCNFLKRERRGLAVK